MIRRWSSINNINFLLLNYKNYEATSKLRLFKSAVYLKRFIFQRTKFKRRSLARWKHKTNWIPYLNVFKYWARDCQFTKQLTRYQYYKNFLFNVHMVYNFNYIKPRHGLSFTIRNNVFTNAISQHLYFYFNKKKKILTGNVHKNTNYLMAYMVEDDSFENNPNILPLYITHNDILYPFKIKSEFNITNTYNLIFELYLKQSVELYKIINMLFFFFLKR